MITTGERPMSLRLMLLAGAALLPSLASAQTYNRMITFGDSLSDNGNLFAVAGTPPSPYFQGRFSNGKVWAEYLNGSMLTVGPSILGIGPTPGTLPTTSNLNFAFGGSRTDATTAVPPGTVSQINNYIALGGKFRAGDLVTLWAGANDIFQATPTQAAVSAAATTAGVNIGNQIRTLAAAGAPTILVMNLPDLGASPSYIANGPLGVQLGSFASSTFNSTWAASVAAAAAANPNTNIIQVPVDQFLNAVISSPGAFGFANVTSQCIQTAACVTGSLATQNTYLFWDSVHPTTAGHALISSYAQEYLFAPTRAAGMASLGDVGFWSRRQGMSDMMDRVQGANPVAGKPDFFISAIGESGTRNNTISSAGFVGNTLATIGGSSTYGAGGLRFGGFAKLGDSWVAGFGISATTGEGKSGNISFTPTAFAADLAARWNGGPTFVNLGLGVQMTHYSDIERKTLVAGLVDKSSTDGLGFSAVAEAGYRFALGSFALVPKARLSYVNAQVNAFNESGIVAPIAFASRTVDGIAAGGELRLEAKLADNATAHALVGYESFLYSSAGSLGGKLINNTAQPFAVNLKDPVGAGLLLGVGADARFGSWTAGANYRATIGERSQVTHRGQITVGASF